MLPTHHAIAAAAVAVPLARRGWRWTSLAAFAAASVLIDVDHYVGYVLGTGDLSLFRAYAYHRGAYRRPRRWRFRPHWPPLGVDPMRAFHSLPALLCLFLLSSRWPPLWPVAWGALFHRALDEAWGSWD